MIRLIYRHYCDRCHNVIVVEEIVLWGGSEIPVPNARKYAGLDLCDQCTKHVEKHLRKAMAE